MTKIRTPAERLIYAIIALGIMLSSVIFLALQHPFVGLKIDIHPEQEMTVSYQQEIILSQVTSFQISDLKKEKTITLTADDFIEEPHFLPHYSELKHFFRTQDQLHDLLKQHSSVLIQGADHKQQLKVQPQRHLGDLPAVFWYQLFVCSLGFLLGCWIWALAPKENTTRCFALLNAMYPVFVLPAAIYSTRDLALNGELIQSLVALNTLGSVLYGAALMSLFLLYPKPLVSPKWLSGIFIFSMLWWLAETAYLFPNPSIGADLPVTLQMLAAILFMIWQWHVNKQDPRARIALRWFAAWILISTGLFVFLIQSSQLFGIQLNLSQGYSFGFFLLVTIGIAIGLSRHQLFNLDRWAFGILYWLAGTLLLVAIDALLVMVLRPLLSFSLAVLICGLLWLPARGWLQSLLFRKKVLSESEIFERALQISFAVSTQARQLQWKTFLLDVFQPLHIEEDATYTAPQLQLHHNGLILEIPQVAGLSALRLSYPYEGRGLFNHSDQALVRNIAQLIQYATDSRLAYDQGVATERQRIAQDLHDDIGAKLLSGLYQNDIEQIRKSIREAMAEMRSMIKGLIETRAELQLILADLQLETQNRLEQIDIQLDWQVQPENLNIHLSYLQYKNYMSIFREAISNIIKYSKANHVSINIYVHNNILTTLIQDNGVGLLEHISITEGYGLHSIEQRARILGGACQYSVSNMPSGFKIELMFPI